MQNHLSELPMRKKFDSNHSLKKKKKKKKNSLFPIVKFNAIYADICRVGNLQADFQQVSLVQFFLKFSQYCCQTSIIQIQQRKV